MISPILFSVISILFFVTDHVALAEQEIVMYSCLNSDNYTAKTPYSLNLATLLFAFANQRQSPDTFYSLPAGQEPYRVHALALCRGDLSPEACAACIKTACIDILALCPNKKKGFAWFDLCMIRYSDEPIYGVLEDNNVMGRWNETDATNGTVFTEKLFPLLTSLQRRAGSGGSTLLKAAEGNVSGGPASLTVYALAQCSPDLSEGDCVSCLAKIEDYVRKWSNGNYKIGGRFCVPSCYLRYETYRFYEPIADVTFRPPGHPSSPSSGPSSTDSPPESQAGRKKTSALRVGMIVLVPALCFVILVMCVCFVLRRRNSNPNVDDDVSTEKSLQIELGVVRHATDGFSESNKLGEGGFGAVYKGKLPDGQDIAAKRLSANSGQGEEEFKNEVHLVAKLEHKNLVRLLGFCFEKKERLLVYEFVHNASLDLYIFDPIKRAELNWERRYNIIKGIVRGLVYLHKDSRHRIIHRDLKASNVLLDAEMEPKISDFGLAKLVALDETHWNTSKIAGTCGYMAPEYAYKGHFSVKSDVFSFGVLVLEIVAGQKNGRFQGGHDEEDFKSYAWRNWREGTAINMVDPTLRDYGSINEFEMVKCIQIGLLCVQEHAASRPSMASVDLMLNSDSITIAAPAQPAFFTAQYSGKYTSIDLGDSTVEQSNTILYGR